MQTIRSEKNLFFAFKFNDKKQIFVKIFLKFIEYNPCFISDVKIAFCDIKRILKI